MWVTASNLNSTYRLYVAARLAKVTRYRDLDGAPWDSRYAVVLKHSRLVASHWAVSDPDGTRHPAGRNAIRYTAWPGKNSTLWRHA